MYIVRWWQGRASRAGFVFNTVAAGALFFMLCSRLGALGIEPLAWVLSALLSFVVLGQCARRLHDLGLSSWCLLALLVPVAGVVWLFSLLAFTRGQLHNNRWGVPPGREPGGFLQVI